MQRLRKERPHRLPDGIGGNDPHDPQPLRHLRRDGALPHSRRAADEYDDRSVFGRHSVPDPVPQQIPGLHAIGEHRLHQPAKLDHADLALRGLQQLPLHIERHCICPLRRKPGRGESRREKPLGERDLVPLAHQLDGRPLGLPCRLARLSLLHGTVHLFTTAPRTSLSPTPPIPGPAPPAPRCPPRARPPQRPPSARCP